MDVQIQVMSMFANVLLPTIPPPSVTSRADCTRLCYYSDTCKSFFYGDASCYLHDDVISDDTSLQSTLNVNYYVLVSANCPFHQGYSFVDVVKLCYKIYTQSESWNSAKTVCTDNGGHLLDLTTLKQVNWASTKLTGDNYWIGANSIAMSNDWRWSDGTSVVISNWVPGGPSGSKKCAFIKSPTGAWDTASCSRKYQFICHIPMSDC